LVGQRVWNLAFSPDQKRLYTTNGTSNDMSIIDLETQTVTKSVGVGTYPWGVAVKP
jgi:YVTN family beta-propeller protein